MRTERLRDMEDYIYEKGTVSLVELCETFGVSINTIRRDVDQIVANTDIKKSYGGVTVDTSYRRDIVSFEDRNVSNADAKNRIAEKAASFIEDGDIIYIDSGTTTARMVPFIKDKNITLITNNIEIIVRILPYDNVKVIGIAGALRRKTFSFVGMTVAEALKPYNITKAFMAATGVSALNGASNSSAEEAYVKKTAVARSRNKYLLVDHTKFDSVSLITFCRLEDMDAIITDEIPPLEINEYLISHNIEVVKAD